MMIMENGWGIYGEPVRGRVCGSCRACCIQVPVDLDDAYKAANERCRHLCSKGCSIYPMRPSTCKAWSCKWLFDPATAGMRRPDQSGYIIDPVLDTLLKGGEPFNAVQVWVDPRRRDAHRDPALRAYLAEVAERLHIPAIVRWSNDEGFVLLAPSLTGAPDWIEHPNKPVSEEEISLRLAAVGVVRPRTRVRPAA